MSNVLSYSVTVNSEFVQKVKYDIKTKELMVNLKSGASYVYPGVSKVVFDKFVIAKSKGRFFNDKIRNRKKFIKVNI
jgi:hypothetical protein